jgi:hypothetical protein
MWPRAGGVSLAHIAVPCMLETSAPFHGGATPLVPAQSTVPFPIHPSTGPVPFMRKKGLRFFLLRNSQRFSSGSYGYDHRSPSVLCGKGLLEDITAQWDSALN